MTAAAINAIFSPILIPFIIPLFFFEYKQIISDIWAKIYHKKENNIDL